MGVWVILTANREASPLTANASEPLTANASELNDASACEPNDGERQ